MVSVLVDIVFALSLLAWLALLTALVVVAAMAAFAMGQKLIRALLRTFISLDDHAAWRRRLRTSDTRFLRTAGIRR